MVSLCIVCKEVVLIRGWEVTLGVATYSLKGKETKAENNPKKILNKDEI